MDLYAKGLITILAADALLAAVAIPLALRRVPRNVIYGFRTQTTLSSDRVWLETNAYFGRALLAASAASAVLVVGLYVLRHAVGAAFLPASVAALVAPSFAAAVAGFRRSRRVAREENTPRRG